VLVDGDRATAVVHRARNGQSAHSRPKVTVLDWLIARGVSGWAGRCPVVVVDGVVVQGETRPGRLRRARRLRRQAPRERPHCLL
jgi:hypothetical protein